MMLTQADMIKRIVGSGVLSDKTPDLFKRNDKSITFNGIAYFNDDETLVLLEVADTPELRATGLMGRKSLLEHCGMIFTDLEGGAFWMKGCHIPLDIVFLDKNNSVSRLYTMPADGGIKRYYYNNEKTAIEMPAGFCKKHGIEVGTKCRWRTW